jgi:PEP-CTERM motif
MRPILLPLLLLSAAVSPVAAHADPIDDFTLTGGGHTLTYSLPAVSSPSPDHYHFTLIIPDTPAKIDGVPGYSVGTSYYPPGESVLGLVVVLDLSPGNDFFTNSGAGGLTGSQFIDWSVVFDPNNRFPNSQYDDVATFIPGTYALQTDLYTGYPIIHYTLTITPENPTAATPEPASLVLLSTGLIALAAIRRRAFLTGG